MGRTKSAATKDRVSTDAIVLQRARLLYVPVERLIPTPDNPRQVIEDAKFGEFVESIRQDGILQPLLARPLPIPPVSDGPARGNLIDRLVLAGVMQYGAEDFPMGLLDLRAGHRRLAAAKQIGLPTVPVIVSEMDDLTALRITIKENLDRNDLTPLEESSGVQRYIERGLTYEQVAAEFGRTPAWVARRAGLNKLTETWRKAVADRDSWAKDWPVASLEQVAALSPDEQEKLFKAIGGQKYYLREGDPEAVIGHIVSEYTRELKRAGWDLDDPALNPKAGACTTCPHRSSASPLLWQTVEDTEIKPGDRCLQPACWRKKSIAHAEHQLRSQKDKHPNLVLVTGYSAAKEVSAAAKRIGLPVLTNYNVTECKASTKGAVPAVTVGENGITKKIAYVKVRDQASARNAMPAPIEQQTAKSIKQLRADLEKRRQEWARRAWCDLLAENAGDVAKKAKSLKDADLLLAVDAFGINGDGPPGTPLNAWRDADLKNARIRLHASVLGSIADSLRWNDAKYAGELIAAIEASALFNDATPTLHSLMEKSIEEIPEPAEWSAVEKSDDAPVPKSKKKRARHK